MNGFIAWINPIQEKSEEQVWVWQSQENAVIVHRGSIKVYSAEGEGTTFTVRIPLIYAAS